MLSFPRTVPFLSSLDAPSGSRWLSLGIPMKIAIIQNKVRRGAGDDGKREKAVPLTNSQNGKTMNTRNISGKQGKSQSGERKLNRKQER